ncbi:MAG: serine/threonine protein kinase [Planctomycetota bacterium]|jgi:serine/threonine protein kinase
MEKHKDDDDFEELLASCIDEYAASGAAGVDSVIAKHPQHADRLRARLQELDRLGLLGTPESDKPQKLGPYTILRRLGLGGMSEVFLAQDPHLGRVVALKSAFPTLAEDSRSRERFDREVRAIAQVSHPAIIPVHDAGEENGRPYFTMEYVEGLTLAQLLDQLRSSRETHDLTQSDVTAEQLARHAGAKEDAVFEAGSPWSRSYIELVCRWVLQIADALAHAHSAGIIHRDVKPSNVMLRPDGNVMLFDFGLARLDDQPALTLSGEFTGTPYYVSPEQLTQGGRSIDAQSDVYSLGVTFYELLTLRRPFEGSSTAEVLHGIQSRDATPPRQFNPRIQRNLELICQTALDRDRERRYPSMDSFADDLRRFLAFEPVNARPLGPLRRIKRLYRYRPALGVAYTLALAILIGLPIGLLWTNAAIRSERDMALRSAAEARRAAALSNQMVGFMVDLFELGQGESAELPASELLSRGLARIPTGRTEEPLVHAALLDTAGRVYSNLGMHDQALRMYDRAFARLRGEVGIDNLSVNEVLHRLAKTHLATGDLATARSIAELSLQGLRDLELDSDEHIADVLLTAARADTLVGEVEQARTRLAEALRIRSELFGERSEACAFVYAELGELELSEGRAHEAAAALEIALSILSASWTPDPVKTTQVRDRLARARQAAGQTQAVSALQHESALVRSRLDAWRTRLSEALPSLPYDYNPTWREDYDASFQSGISALVARNPKLARDSFQTCLHILPANPIAAYNLACSLTMLGQEEQALGWLEKAVEWGFGQTSTNEDTLLKDLDLAPLRNSPRFAQAGERILEKRSELSIESQSLAAMHAGDDARPLLVVLHRRGSSPTETRDSVWGQAAADNGWHAWMPSAVGLTGGSTQDASWYASPKDFDEHGEEWTEGILAELDSLINDPRVDRARVWLAAEGDACPLATSIAFGYPGLFRRLILLDGSPDPQTRRPEGRAAALSGLPVDLLTTSSDATRWAKADLGPKQLLDGVRAWLQSFGFEMRGALVHDRAALSQLLRPTQ